MYPTTISSWALLIARTLDHHGINSYQLFKQAGLDPEKLNDANARYSYENMKALWELVTKRTNDPCFGIQVAQFWHPTSLHALGYSWMASSTLKEAIERLVRSLRVVSTVIELVLEEQTDNIYLKFPDTKKSGARDEAMDAGMAVIIHMCRITYGEGFNPLAVSMVRDRPDCDDKFDAFFKAPINYSSSENYICFSRYDLEKRLLSANPELVRVNDRIVSDYMAELDKNDIIAQVRIKIIDQLPSGNVTQDSIAKSLNKSLRSLQRKLTNENVTYKYLLNSTRKQLAKQYMYNSKYSINEVTYLLGFSEPSNFSRAFKRWTGQSPSEYRDSH